MPTSRPNILLIVLDHLTPRVTGACGARRSCTPNIDALAAAGCVDFTAMYANCPLCQPSRASFWTGLLPHRTGVLSNGGPNTPHCDEPVGPEVPTVGSLLSEAGYRMIHFGKCHDAGSLRGFEVVEQGSTEIPAEHPAWPYNGDTFRDRRTTDQCVEFLATAANEQRPRMVVADLNNPHNICGWIGENIGEHTDVEIDGDLPPLPDNFDLSDLATLPPAVCYICCSHRRLSQAARWNETNYRHYIAAYEHYTRVGDAMAGEILRAAQARDDWDNTLVIVMADHGDGMASHRMVTKQVSFYDETTRVPFLVAGPALRSRDCRQAHELCSLLDLLPTLCDLAGATPPDPPSEVEAGRSLRPILKGDRPRPWRPYVVSQWFSEWGFTISPGRMLRTGRYKYTHYLEGPAEELYDLAVDPGEKVNLAAAADHQAVLAEHRRLFEAYLAASQDPYRQLTVKVDPRWRSHEPGYWNHVGDSAPEAMGR